MFEKRSEEEEVGIGEDVVGEEKARERRAGSWKGGNELGYPVRERDTRGAHVPVASSFSLGKKRAEVG